MSKDKAVAQRIANVAKERRMSRDDAFTAYAMDRLLYRLGRSRHARGFWLKGGVLVASFVGAHHRFTRDVDVLQRRGPPDPDDLRTKFRQIVAVSVDDGAVFGADAVHAVVAVRDDDGYDGVKVTIRGTVGAHEFTVRIDVGFGDAVVPPGARVELPPFLADDPPARVWAYGVEPVLAEKIETLVSKFPAIRHRLKDILDVIVLADRFSFDGALLTASLRATFERRGTPTDVAVLDDLRDTIKGRAWATAWAAMVEEKAVAQPPDLAMALERFDRFVRPLMVALDGGETPGTWERGGPWTA